MTPRLTILILLCTSLAFGQRGVGTRFVQVITPLPKPNLAWNNNYQDTNTVTWFLSHTNLLAGNGWQIKFVGTNGFFYAPMTNSLEFFKVINSNTVSHLVSTNWNL